jgi:hypothetical protein
MGISTKCIPFQDSSTTSIQGQPQWIADLAIDQILIMDQIQVNKEEHKEKGPKVTQGLTIWLLLSNLPLSKLPLTQTQLINQLRLDT